MNNRHLDLAVRALRRRLGRHLPGVHIRRLCNGHSAGQSQ
jgi:hypothetical protein